MVLPEIEIVGVGFTVTVIAAVFEQLPEAPITLYVVLIRGESVSVDVVAPVFQL
jgi:hypothetical protein